MKEGVLLSEIPTEIPYGYCHCGCGQKTSISTFNDSRNGYKKGEPKKFIRFHGNIKPTLIPKNCVICGKEFLPRKKNRQESQKTCSAKCRNAYVSIIGEPKRTAILKSRNKGHSYRKSHYRHEHRIVMERILGRSLLPNEIIHHIDGDKLNNNPENLMLLTRAEHALLHFEEYRKQKKASNQ